MLLALIPLFNENLAVEAYSIFAQKNNLFQNPMLLGTAKNDGSPRTEGLEMVEEIGIPTLSEGKPVFVPVTNIGIFSDLEAQCGEQKSKVVLLFDNTVPPIPMYVERLKELKAMGFGLAIHKIPVTSYVDYTEVFKLMDYVILNTKKVAVEKAKIYFDKVYPGIKICAGNITDMDQFESIKGQFELYEGDFYRVPVTKGEHELSALKYNYIELLNVVNNDDFDLTKAADTIAQDPALTISLLKMVNRFSRNSRITSVRHAAAMLGQKEVKKWINTAVVNEMYSDKPGEITRVSLIRARFAENLAGLFGLVLKKEELFLMGIFSMLDTIMDKPIEEALKLVHVSRNVEDALVRRTGEFAEIYDFILNYEAASWQEVSRIMITLRLDMDAVGRAYSDAIIWYRDVILSNE